jgi:hypothetical protein
MKNPLAVLGELWDLFVDDGSLALSLVLWCAAAGLIVPRVIVSNSWDAVILFVGCVAILVVNVAAAVRRHASQ